MIVKPFESQWTTTVVGWLNDEENWKWLQFGKGKQKLDQRTFRIMTQRPIHNFKLYFDPHNTSPIGLVALSDIDQISKSATLWYVLGEKNYSGNGYTCRAVKECLRYAFHEMKLESVYAWTVSDNKASIRILEKNHFTFIGRRRRCHPMNNLLYDRLLYDILLTEFEDLLQ